MTRIIIYTGLSLPFDEAKEILDSTDDIEVIYKRPIQRGDLNLALKEHPDIIGIIDGVFHQSSAVGHKEILNVMKNGIEVYGASSMGALRASELDTLGMTGVGYVYNQYASGKVDSDDDVAVMLDSESLEALSEPLINMKYVFTNASCEGIITEEERDELLAITKKTFYPKRSYAKTLADSNLDNDKKNKLINFIRESPDIKKEDAKELLKTIKKIDNMTLEQKIDIVKDILKDKEVAIGFSGGADSTLIAYLSSQVAKDTLAITIDNHLMPTGFIEYAKNVTSSFGIRHEIIDIDFYEDPDFLENRPDRCFTCRNLMYTQIESMARKNGFDFICDGNNISDLVIDRPGILITYAKGFNTPLIEARLTSKEIHEYLNENNVPYSRSTTCLATRIPTNTKTTKEKISRISHCEDYILNNTDCKIIKVRDFEELCICETDDISKIMIDNKFKQINDELNRQGYKKVALNLSEIDDDESIVLDYAEGSFSYSLPFSIDIEKSREFFENAKITKDKISIENISISENGMIVAKGFDNYENALNAFMDILTKIRRKIE